jgi:hypothetical protein
MTSLSTLITVIKIILYMNINFQYMLQILTATEQYIIEDRHEGKKDSIMESSNPMISNVHKSKTYKRRKRLR